MYSVLPLRSLICQRILAAENHYAALLHILLMILPAMLKSRLYPRFYDNNLSALYVRRRMNEDVAFLIGVSYNKHDEEALQSSEFLHHIQEPI